MTKQTYELLGRPGISPRYIDVPHHKIEIDGIPLMIDYFGPAHSPDNVTIWEETNMLLFGGCLIKSLDSMTLGNIADADLKNWPIGIEKLQGKYANARIVVPGHGDYGDSDLLDHTYQLFK
ncbi:MAG: hypothetical protein A2413_18500 [Treponema sp. RIFOXYC1_FULL_61_9]|nr:MAG: hypothetical protein A2001_16450 [Treponema sp. GWC1_61_84]OHE76584.1 MAG: hypothetical protein A2413_18500 [Treponema sp. RIFOXYC1_FULL_61_9]